MNRGKLGENCVHLQKYLWSRIAVIVVPAIQPDHAWPMVRVVQSLARETISERSAGHMRGRAVHKVEMAPDQDQEEVDQIDMVNVNSISFNRKHFIITVILKNIIK